MNSSLTSYNSKAAYGKKSLNYLDEYFQVVYTNLIPSHDTVEQISVTDQQLFKAKMALRYIPPLGHAAERICERYSKFTRYSLDKLLNHPEVYRFYYTSRKSDQPVFQIVSIEYRIVLIEKDNKFFVKTFIDHINGPFNGLTMQKFSDWEQARKKVEKAKIKAEKSKIKAEKAAAEAQIKAEAKTIVKSTKKSQMAADRARINIEKAAAKSKFRAEKNAAKEQEKAVKAAADAQIKAVKAVKAEAYAKVNSTKKAKNTAAKFRNKAEKAAVKAQVIAEKAAAMRDKIV